MRKITMFNHLIKQRQVAIRKIVKIRANHKSSRTPLLVQRPNRGRCKAITNTKLLQSGCHTSIIHQMRGYFVTRRMPAQKQKIDPFMNQMPATNGS